MTLTDLLSLAASIQLALVGDKPQGYANITDALRASGQPLPPYTLRVLDALCDVGHVKRISPAHDGPRRYQLGTVTEDTRELERRLRVVFADDLIEAAAPAPQAPPPPAPAPAATHNAAPAEAPAPLPRPPEATPINTHSLTPVTRGRPERYRPEDTLRVRILGLASEAQTFTRTWLISRLWDVKPNRVDATLSELAKRGDVQRIGTGRTGQYAAVPADQAPPPPPMGRPRRLPAWSPSTGYDGAAPAAVVEKALKSSPRTLKAAVAAQAPQPKPATAAAPDRAIVLATLRRLSPLMAPDISRVLDDAAHYIATHLPEAA